MFLLMELYIYSRWKFEDRWRLLRFPGFTRQTILTNWSEKMDEYSRRFKYFWSLLVPCMILTWTYKAIQENDPIFSGNVLASQVDQYCCVVNSILIGCLTLVAPCQKYIILSKWTLIYKHYWYCVTSMLVWLFFIYRYTLPAK